MNTQFWIFTSELELPLNKKKISIIQSGLIEQGVKRMESSEEMDQALAANFARLVHKRN